MLRSLALAVAAVAVTATVTFGQGPEIAVVTLRDNATGAEFAYNKRKWAPAQCEDAIRGLNKFLEWIADGNPHSPAVGAPDADPLLFHDLQVLIVERVQRTGKMPSFRISCETPGAPA